MPWAVKLGLAQKKQSTLFYVVERVLCYVFSTFKVPPRVSVPLQIGKHPALGILLYVKPGRKF